jgi:hypothetical protein
VFQLRQLVRLDKGTRSPAVRKEVREIPLEGKSAPEYLKNKPYYI